MSVNIERNELIKIAETIYQGNLEIEEYLKRARPTFFKKIEEKLWGKLVGDHPYKDFSGGKVSKTRDNIRRRLVTVVKGKQGFKIQSGLIEVFRWFIIACC